MRPREGTNPAHDSVIVKAKIAGGSDKGLKTLVAVGPGEVEVWFPKSQVRNLPTAESDGFVKIPRWLASTKAEENGISFAEVDEFMSKAATK